MTKPLDKPKVPGHPRMKCEEVEGFIVAVWDSGPKDNDRYTVVDLGNIIKGSIGEEIVQYYGMNECPFSPNMGVAQTGEISLGLAHHAGRGGCVAFKRRIKFSDLPPDCQKAALQWLRS